VVYAILKLYMYPLPAIRLHILKLKFAKFDFGSAHPG